MGWESVQTPSPDQGALTSQARWGGGTAAAQSGCAIQPTLFTHCRTTGAPATSPAPSLQLPPPEPAAPPAPTVPSPHLCQLLLVLLCSRWVPERQWWAISHSLTPQAALTEAPWPPGPPARWKTGPLEGCSWAEGVRGLAPLPTATPVSSKSAGFEGGGDSKNPRRGGRPDPFPHRHLSPESQPSWGLCCLQQGVEVDLGPPLTLNPGIPGGPGGPGGQMAGHCWKTEWSDPSQATGALR